MPVTASTYTPSPTQPLPLAEASPAYSPAYITQTAPKPASWGGPAEAATAIYAPSLPDPYAPQQTYTAAPHQELYHQSLHAAPHQHGF